MRRYPYLLFPLALLALAALACDLLVPIPPTQTPLARTLTPTVEGGAGPPAGETPVPSGGGSVGGAALNLDDPALYAPPAGVNTYRSMLVFEFVGVRADGSSVTGSVRAHGAHQVEPRASSLTFTSQGAALTGGAQTFAFTELAGQQYIVTSGTGCLTSAAGQPDNPFGTFLDSGGFLTGQAQRVQPDEVVNGVNTQVYSLDNTNLDPAAPTANDVTNLTQGRLYLAAPGGYVVRLLMDGTGASDVLTGDPNLQGDVHYQLDFLDFNQPVSIVQPPECSGAAGPVATVGDLPVLDDAFSVNSATGLLTYRSRHNFDDAVNFYRSEMFGRGWTAGGENLNPPNALLFFTRGAEQATITIEDESGELSIAIASGQQ